MFTASDATHYWANGKLQAIIQPNDSAERARLTLQHTLLTRSQGGVGDMYPELATLDRVLDLGCGTGAWAMDVAFTFPELEVIGSEWNDRSIGYAQAQARTRKIDNVEFQTMALEQSLPFQDNYFDLVHMRFLSASLPDEAWPGLFGECLRVLRPEGRVWVVECIEGVSSSQALEELSTYYAEALRLVGQRNVPGGSVLPLTELLDYAGFEAIQREEQCFDFSLGSVSHHGMTQNILVFLRLVQPFLEQMHMVSEVEFLRLYNEVSLQLEADDFLGQWRMQTIIGYKASTSAI